MNKMLSTKNAQGWGIKGSASVCEGLQVSATFRWFYLADPFNPFQGKGLSFPEIDSSW